MGSRGSPTSAPIKEENEDPYQNATGRANINDLPLFSSPSMPNISLGRPHLPAPPNHYIEGLQQAPANGMVLHALMSSLRAHNLSQNMVASNGKF